MIRAVLDTSALYPFSLRRDLHQAAADGLFVGLWSPWIIAELNRVLAWRWMRTHGGSSSSEKACGDAAKIMMELLLPTFELVAPLPPYPPAWHTLSGSYDYPIWAAAVVGKAGYVVSEDTRHYPPRQVDGRHVYQGIEDISARSFLSMIVGQ
jgi:hypothetical protein